MGWGRKKNYNAVEEKSNPRTTNNSLDSRPKGPDL
jgi:hypothetical protein